MPSIPEPCIHFARHAAEIPQHVVNALYSVERNANVILPTILKAREATSGGEKKNADTCETSQAWVWSEIKGQVEFILSCTDGPIGAYPVFIISTLPFEELENDHAKYVVKLLTHKLFKTVLDERVYSVFAPKPLAQTFAIEWTELTGIGTVEELYYDANISYCTTKTLRKNPLTTQGFDEIELRPAVVNDLEEVAKLCKGFSVTSEPFVLDDDGARLEAEYLVKNHLVWGHWIKHDNCEERILACIVAFTRNSDSVATITKVFTSPDTRQKGYAERLVRRVCNHLLRTKKEVVLFVGKENPAAKVYNRVGFVGLAPGAPPINGVDPWVEVGFDPDNVQLGQW